MLTLKFAVLLLFLGHSQFLLIGINWPLIHSSQHYHFPIQSYPFYNSPLSLPLGMSCRLLYSQGWSQHSNIPRKPVFYSSNSCLNSFAALLWQDDWIQHVLWTRRILQVQHEELSWWRMDCWHYPQPSCLSSLPISCYIL